MKKCVFCLLAVVFTSTQARSEGLESAYSPEGMREAVIQLCLKAGISPLPASFAVPGLAEGRVGLIRWDQTIVGQMEYRSDIAHGASQFTVFDTQNHVLAQATRTVTPCPPGRCTDTVFTTVLDAAGGTGAPFEIADNSMDRTDYLRYGQVVNPVLWQADFQGSMRWLGQMLVQSPTAVRLCASDPKQALELALASDPAVAPYLGNLTVVNEEGTLVIIGVVPSSAVFSALAARASAYGPARLDVDILTP